MARVPHDQRSRDKVPDKLLELVLIKCEGAKKDLEKNWLYQIMSIGLSLGLVLGLGEIASRKVFDEPGHETVLFFALPLVNLYLFMRFGSVASAFSQARYAAEELSIRYFTDEQIGDLKLGAMLTPDVLYATNSYFEYFHKRQSNAGIFIYSLFVPVLFSLNHSVSIYLIIILLGKTLVGYLAAAIYCLPLIGLYVAYYVANRQLPFVYKSNRLNFLLLSNTLTLVLCFLFLFWAFDYGGSITIFNLGAVVRN